jgi:hypothetical protein
VGAIVDIDDGTDVCSCFASGECAMTLVGLDHARVTDRVRMLDRIEWNRYVQVLLLQSPQGDLAQEIARASATRTRERRIFVERDRPPPPQASASFYEDPPNVLLGDGDVFIGGGGAGGDDDDDDSPAVIPHRTVAIKIKGGKMRVGLTFDKLAAKVVHVL